MTRDAGQVSTRRALAGLVAFLAALWLVIAGLEALVQPGERVAELEAPADPLEAGCPSPEALEGVHEPVKVRAELLLECPREYDGRIVAYTGEVVRAVLMRHDRAWVQLNDDAYASTAGPIPETRTAAGGNSGIAVSVPHDVAVQIVAVGGHNARGDILTVRGVFQRADPADDGGPTIQAVAAHVEEPGHRLRHVTDRRRGLVALLLAIAAVVATMLARRRTSPRGRRSMSQRAPPPGVRHHGGHAER